MSGGVWSLQATLKAGDGAVDDGFGTATIDISGNTIIVGAPGAGALAGACNSVCIKTARLTFSSVLLVGLRGQRLPKLSLP